MQVADRFVPIAAIDQIVPIRDLVIHRTAVVAIGNAAIHAARGLVARGFLAERDDELAVMANAIGGRRIAPVAAIDFEEARYLTHSARLLPERFVGATPAKCFQNAAVSTDVALLHRRC